MISNPPSSFDPYHVWLGIPPAEQPADHYRLLGIPRFEESQDVIESAADRQMAHVRSFQSGSRAKESQRLLNEIAAARVCLLNPQAKASYDASLRGSSGDRWNFDPAESLASGASPAEVAVQTTSPSKGRKKVVWRPIAMWAGLAGAIVVVGIAIAIKFGGRREEAPPPVSDSFPVRDAEPIAKPREQIAVSSEPRLKEKTVTIRPPVEEVEEPSETVEQPAGFADLSSEFDALAKLSAETASDDNVFEDAASAEAVESVDALPPVESRQEPLPVPTQDALEAAKVELQSREVELLLIDGEPRKAKAILDLAKSAEVEPAIRYLLFEKAVERSLEQADVELALRVLDDAGLWFQSDPWQRKFELLTALQQESPTVAELEALFSGCQQLIATALEEGRLEEAELVGQLVEDAMNRPQAGHLRAHAQALHETTARLNRQYQGYVSAMKRLKTSPDDSAANLEVGRWCCFVLEDWPTGLPYLAKGSDPGLAEAAAQDLVPGDTPEDWAVVGDAWWDVASSHPEAADAIKRRAVHYYELAAAQPDNSLSGVRMEQRMAETLQIQKPIVVRNPAHRKTLD